jgi:hypothetical protein
MRAGEPKVPQIEEGDVQALLQGLFSWLQEGAFHGPPNVKTIANLLCAFDTAAFVTEHMPDLEIDIDILGWASDAATVDGLICEFGVFEGRTLRQLATLNPGRPVWGFDSFEGLPEDFPGAPKGDFDVGGRLPPDLPANAHCVPGWFDQTLPGFVAAHPGPLRLLHIDCDLYSSTRTVFEHLGPRLVPGSIILFDEYFNYIGWKDHEHKAWTEYAEQRGLRFRYAASEGLRKIVVKVLEC